MVVKAAVDRMISMEYARIAGKEVTAREIVQFLTESWRKGARPDCPHLEVKEVKDKVKEVAKEVGQVPAAAKAADLAAAAGKEAAGNRQKGMTKEEKEPINWSIPRSISRLRLRRMR